MTHKNDNIVQNIFEEIEQSPGALDLSGILSNLINLAMQAERDKALGVGPYERSENRSGHRNGFKDKSLMTRVGAVKLKVPQVRGDLEFYPGAIEKGCRSERALKLAIAQMYVWGVSTRKVSKITEELCGVSVSQAQVSDAAKLLDDEISKWREKPLGRYRYIILDATYEKVRMSGTVVSAAVLVAFGVDYEGRRSVLGMSTALSEAEVHWREFLKSLVARGLHGVDMITSDAHEGLKAARTAVFPSVPWQRCQFHVQRNAITHIPKLSMRKEVHEDIRTVFNAPNFEEANRYLDALLQKYQKSAPELSMWAENAIPEALTVFSIPKEHRKKLRTSNMAERQMKEIKRRTKIAVIFPNTGSVNRLVSAVLMETDDTWQDDKIYLTKIE